MEFRNGSVRLSVVYVVYASSFFMSVLEHCLTRRYRRVERRPRTGDVQHHLMQSGAF